MNNEQPTTNVIQNKAKQSQFEIVEKLLALESIVTIIADLEQT